MLDVTSVSVRAFCALNGYEYESFRGLKFGRRPQDATYNRIALLNEAIDAGFDGWLAFLDTDAFIVDLRFDLDAYLRRHDDRALVLRPSAPGAQDAWRVNAGVLFVNARHPLAVGDGEAGKGERRHRTHLGRLIPCSAVCAAA